MCGFCGARHGAYVSCYEAAAMAPGAPRGLGSGIVGKPVTAEQRLRVAAAVAPAGFDSFVPTVLAEHGLSLDAPEVAAMVANVRSTCRSL